MSGTDEGSGRRVARQTPARAFVRLIVRLRERLEVPRYITLTNPAGYGYSVRPALALTGAYRGRGMRFGRRSTPISKAAIDLAIATISAARVGTDTSPEWAALLLATDKSVSAGKVRSALGGYVPLGHPGHPSKWSAERQAELATAEAGVLRTTEALRIAKVAHTNRPA